MKSESDKAPTHTSTPFGKVYVMLQGIPQVWNSHLVALGSGGTISNRIHDQLSLSELLANTEPAPYPGIPP